MHVNNGEIPSAKRPQRTGPAYFNLDLLVVCLFSGWDVEMSRAAGEQATVVHVITGMPFVSTRIAKLVS